MSEIVLNPDMDDRFPDQGGDLSQAPTVILIADGWRSDTFQALLQDGDLPGISEHLLKAGRLYPNVISNVPSVSIASHASILTGEYQERHNIPAHRWMNAAEGTCHDYLRSLGSKAVNQDLSPDVSTVFESHGHRDSTISVQSLIQRGASQHITVPSIRSGPIMNAAARAISATPDSTTVVWLPRGDALSHVRGPSSAAVRADMIETSQAIERIARSLGELWARAEVLFVPDHGHREVSRRTPLEEVLDSVNENSIVNPHRRRTFGQRVVAMTSGDSSAFLYTNRADGAQCELARSVAQHPDVELACLRLDGEFLFYSSDGVGRCWLTDPSLARYVVEGVDPLGICTDGGEALIDLSIGSQKGKYPDFLHQYLRSFVAERSARILIFPARDTHFGRGPRVAWRLGFHRGTHGGPYDEEVRVSAVFKPHDVAQLATLPPAHAHMRSADLLGSLAIVREDVTDSHHARTGSHQS